MAFSFTGADDEEGELPYDAKKHAAEQARFVSPPPPLDIVVSACQPMKLHTGLTQDMYMGYMIHIHRSPWDSLLQA